MSEGEELTQRMEGWHCELMSRIVVCNLWGCHLVDLCCLDSSGASGGVLIIWDRRVVEKIDECVGK
jgi:hypothetical protein